MPNTKVVGIIFPYILTPIPNLYDHSFPRYGQITFLTFRRPTTLTFDLNFWKYLSVTVYPYVICMPSFIMIGWEMAEILHFEILRKHGQTNTPQTNTHTNKQTHTQTDMGITIPRPPPMGGEVKRMYEIVHTPIDASDQGRSNMRHVPISNQDSQDSHRRLSLHWLHEQKKEIIFYKYVERMTIYRHYTLCYQWSTLVCLFGVVVFLLHCDQMHFFAGVWNHALQNILHET